MGRKWCAGRFKQWMDPLFLIGRMGRRSSLRDVEGQGQMARFRADVRSGWKELRRTTSNSHKWLVFAVVAAGLVLRLARLGDGITYDEAFTASFYASRTTGFLLSDYSWPGNHLLFTLLVKLTMQLFGTHLWSLRLPALLAGVCVLPLFYLFVRQMFNRYVAVLALSFVAASGALIEYSALARGFSLSWLFMVAAWVAGRHLAKRNNTVSALLVALFCALGMWAAPAMLPAALSTYLWLLLYLLSLYKTSLNRRLPLLLLSFTVFIVLTALAYTPVVMTHNLGHLLRHPALGEYDWAQFTRTHQDRAAALWVFLNDTTNLWLSLILFIGMAYAAYISAKYRSMLIALIGGCVPLVLIRASVGAPEGWAFLLFNVYIGTALALFYLLKFVQENIHAGFGKRFRTALACALVLMGLGWAGITRHVDHGHRFVDVPKAAAWFKGTLHPGDRVRVAPPADAPFKFHLRAEGMDPAYVNATGGNGRLYALVSPAEGQTVGRVIKGDPRSADSTAMVKVMDWRRVEIWLRP